MQKRKSFLRKITSLLLAFAIFGAWYWFELETHIPVKFDGGKLVVVDGDSFSDGARKLRLDGIDAPEYRQTCHDATGAAWNCGKSARDALEKLLREPGVACVAEATDRYARAVATCSNHRVPDIAAAQVLAGLAVSDEFYGMRSYGDEEDIARAAKRGIWAGEFMLPSDWRAQHPR